MIKVLLFLVLVLSTVLSAKQVSTFEKPALGSDGYIHAPGYCIMYDSCGINTSNKKNINCVYNGRAKEVVKSSTIELINEVCPYMYKGPNTTISTCCSEGQLLTMKDNFKLPYQYLSRCPSCYRNFIALFCEMTCSPNQSTFTNVLKNETGNSPGFEPFNSTAVYLTQLGYNVTNQFADAMFNSCQHVNSPSTNTPALNILCGPYGDKCNGQNWINYLTDITNGQVPFEIDVTYESDLTKAMNYTTDSCDQPSYLGESPCSCSDCPAACTGPPPVPPPPPKPWLIWGIDGSFVVMTFVFAGFTILFLNLVVLMHCCKKKKQHYSSVDNDCCTVVDNSAVSSNEDDLGIRSVNAENFSNQVGCIERWGHFLENLLQTAFRKLGLFCARYPVIVIFIGLIVVGACAAGLKFMQVTTDPVELWSAPTSTSRQQKNYFDEHFGPFYRTEELIIQALNSSRTIYKPYTQSTDPKDQQHIPFGPILRIDILQEILKLQNNVTALTATYKNKTVTLSDICLKPLAPDNNNCTIMSVLNYFQNDEANLDKKIWIFQDVVLGADYHDHLISCTSGPAAVDDATSLHLPCLGTFGGPIFPWVALGGFDAKNYLNATAAVITIPVVNYYNDTEKLNMALAWEQEFIKFMKKYKEQPNPILSVNFSAERSIEDEINRESGADVKTIVISYVIMFVYVAIALGKFGNINRLLIDCQLTVGLSGVLIVLCSVAMSLGLFSYFGIPMTLIIAEVVPFLALAVGVDNIFILVQHLQRDERSNKETVEEQISRVLGEVAPSMFLSSISETLAFFLGGLSTMPAVRTFSMFAGLAIFCDFLLQITCFVAILSLDRRRQLNNRVDCICCVTADTDDDSESEGFLYWLFKNFFSPAVLSKYVRPIIIVVFVGLSCFSGAVLHKVEIGLDQSLSMPEDSYVLDYFYSINNFLSTGAPVYFVVKEGQDYSTDEGANQVCGGSGCNNNSLIQQISFMAKMPNYSRIAYPPSSWIDDYFDWLKPQSSCCRYQLNGTAKDFCSATEKNLSCTSCRTALEERANPRPTPTEFNDYLPWFLKDNPGIDCGKGGHAAYAAGVNLIKNGTNSTTVGASYFMGYHTIARTSADFIGCLEHANSISKEITKSMQTEVFPYSVFYVYYEQYLTIVNDTLFNLGISVAAVFVVVFLVLGFDLVSALVVVINILMILLDMFGCMFLWNIPLNAVSLVNLVMAVGISVEFCAHVTRAFALSQCPSRVGRAKEALAEMGSSVCSGITLTKFFGIVILAFSTSQIFKVFYFRMYLCVVLLGAGHGLIFLPVLLSYIGPKRRVLNQRYKKLDEEVADDPPLDVNGQADTHPILS